MTTVTARGLTGVSASRRALHERDMANGEASVWLRHALDGKYLSSFRTCQFESSGNAKTIGIQGRKTGTKAVRIEDTVQLENGLQLDSPTIHGALVSLV